MKDNKLKKKLNKRSENETAEGSLSKVRILSQVSLYNGTRILGAIFGRSFCLKKNTIFETTSYKRNFFC